MGATITPLWDITVAQLPLTILTNVIMVKSDCDRPAHSYKTTLIYVFRYLYWYYTGNLKTVINMSQYDCDRESGHCQKNTR